MTGKKKSRGGKFPLNRDLRHTTKDNEWVVFGFWFDPVKCKINFLEVVGIFFMKGHYVKP